MRCERDREDERRYKAVLEEWGNSESVKKLKFFGLDVYDMDRQELRGVIYFLLENAPAWTIRTEPKDAS